MTHLFSEWPQIAAQVRDADGVALFLDFDGTLAPIRPRPEDAHLHDSTRRAITRLTRNPRVRVWLVSGRRLADVRLKTGVPGVCYIGLHGAEGPGRNPLNREAQRLLDRVKRKVGRLVAAMPGIRIEDKGPVIGVHYRGAEESEVAKARSAIRTALAGSNGNLRVLQGRQAWEILPLAVGDKGTAVRRELSRLGRSMLPVYAGDDATDEPAFAALRHGITIRVGRRALTHAKFQLRDTNEVRSFLERLEAELS